MDPNNNNNNQPINTNPLNQPVTPEPVVATTLPVAPASPAQQANPTPVSTYMPEIPKGGSKKGIILIIILLILALGMAFYVFFVKNQLNTAKKASIENTSIIILTPTITPTPTPATVDQVNVASPEADLKGIETDVQGL